MQQSRKQFKGETGVYAILVGTLTAGANYNMSFSGASLTITSSILPPLRAYFHLKASLSEPHDCPQARQDGN